MLATLACLAATQAVGPFNLRGRFVDLAPEGVAWGSALPGVLSTVTIESGKVTGPAEFKLAANRWTGPCALKLANLSYANGTLTCSPSLTNGSGKDLTGVRFDIVSATETYEGKDKDGKPVMMTRSMAVAEDSPILFGEMPAGTDAGGFSIQATGLGWKPETRKIEVQVQTSGFTFQRQLFKDHTNCHVATDRKGRLLIGSGQVGTIYRANPDNGEIESVGTVPDYRVSFAVDPTTGNLAASWMGANKFKLLGPGGDEIAEIPQADGEPGRTGWAGDCAFDELGRLYLNFGTSLARFKGSTMTEVVPPPADITDWGIIRFAVEGKGTVYLANRSTVYRIGEDGKSKKVLFGPDWRPGRLHGVDAIWIDKATQTLYVGSDHESGYYARVDAFDLNGKYRFTLGRGNTKPNEAAERWDGQILAPVSGVVSPNGTLFVGVYDTYAGVMEYSPIRP
ncbi:MAG: hypothetical protein JST35_05830 [Armatimonadetes bacterium]|nr:hypothetical protein [Armatimonadota bacterium]